MVSTRKDIRHKVLQLITIIAFIKCEVIKVSHRFDRDVNQL